MDYKVKKVKEHGYIVTENGHTMFPEDVKTRLRRLAYLEIERSITELKTPKLIEVSNYVLNVKEITRIDKVNIRMVKNGYINTDIIDCYSTTIWNGKDFLACLEFKTMEELQEKRAKILSMMSVEIL